MSPITTHILDTHRGCPAAGVQIVLREQKDGIFQPIASGKTNEDGRLPGLLAEGTLRPGIYQMYFATEAYHASLGIKGFYPEVVVTFEIVHTDQHYHIPLLLSPFGYSTYRGS